MGIHSELARTTTFLFIYLVLTVPHPVHAVHQVLQGADEKKKVKAESATMLSVTTSAFATPIYDDDKTWGQENATQATAYQAYLRSFYASASADRNRWPWLDDHVLFGVLGGNNGYEVNRR